MTFMPVVIVGGAVSVWGIFELVFALLGRQTVGGYEKKEWAVMCWLVIIVILCCCKLLRATEIPLWIPGLLVALIHIFSDCDVSFGSSRPRSGVSRNDHASGSAVDECRSPRDDETEEP